MKYVVGQYVIISTFKKNKIGKVTELYPTKLGVRYNVITEDNQHYDEIYVDDITSATYINSKLTLIVLKNKSNDY